MHLTIHDSCTSPSDAALPAERRTLLTEAETFKLTASLFTRGGAQRMAQRAALAAEGARSGVFTLQGALRRELVRAVIWARARPLPSEYAALVAGTSLAVPDHVMARG